MQTSTASENVAPSATIIKTIADASVIECTAGNKYSYPKVDIVITYDTESITGKKQYVVADIAGTC